MTTLYDFCIQEHREALLEEWDSSNGSITPLNRTCRSREKVAWRCKLGHVWQASVVSRTERNTGCPYCAGKQAYEGFNDLATRHPELATEWLADKNFCSPTTVTAGSNFYAWWKCTSCGHEWQAKVKSRVQGSGCPACANRVVVAGKNDLRSVLPRLAAQWHPVKNGTLLPEQVVSGSTLRVWWQCEEGHSWKASINSRARGYGCPYCTGKKIIPGETDFATNYPELLAEWIVERNGQLAPHALSTHSNKQAWWRCKKGHEWKAPISQRVDRKIGCPYCANRRVLAGFNDLATIEPKIADQWHPTKNGSLTPQMVTCGSTKKVWWKCALGHEWLAVIHSRAGNQRCGCPICAGRKPRTHNEYQNGDYDTDEG